jgi:hypothetical protein
MPACISLQNLMTVSSIAAPTACTSRTMRHTRARMTRFPMSSERFKRSAALAESVGARTVCSAVSEKNAVGDVARVHGAWTALAGRTVLCNLPLHVVDVEVYVQREGDDKKIEDIETRSEEERAQRGDQAAELRLKDDENEHTARTEDRTRGT